MSKPHPRDDDDGPEPERLWFHLGPWLAYRGMRARELAAAIGKSESTVSRYVSNTKLMPMDAQIKAARVLDCRPVDFLAHPDNRSADAMLVGLPEKERERAIRHLEFYINENLPQRRH